MINTHTLPLIGGHRFRLEPAVNTPHRLVGIAPNTNGELDAYLNSEIGAIVINTGDLRVEDGIVYRAYEKPELGKDHVPSDELIEGMSLDDIERLDISSLKDWIYVISDQDQGHVTIELKGSSVDMVVKLAKLVNDLLFEEIIDLSRVAVESFCVEAMQYLADSLEGNEHHRYGLGLLWASGAKFVEMKMHLPAIDDVADMGDDEVTPWWLKGLIQASGMGLDFISVHWTLVTDEFLAVARRLNLEVSCWVVGDVAKARELADKGCYVLTESAEVYAAISGQ